MTTAEVFTRAAGLVREGWCQGAYARSRTGATVAVGDPAACQWCLQGALARAGTIQRRRQDISEARVLVNEAVGRATDWNDDPARTQAEVAALLDRLAEEAS